MSWLHDLTQKISAALTAAPYEIDALRERNRDLRVHNEVLEDLLRDIHEAYRRTTIQIGHTYFSDHAHLRSLLDSIAEVLDDD